MPYLNGPTLGLHKTLPLINELGCVPLSNPPTLEECRNALPELAVICVISNGPFDAAAVIDSQYDYDACVDPRDNRPKQWLLAETDKIKNYITS